MKLCTNTQRLFLEITNSLCIRGVVILYGPLMHFIGRGKKRLSPLLTETWKRNVLNQRNNVQISSNPSTKILRFFGKRFAFSNRPRKILEKFLLQETSSYGWLDGTAIHFDKCTERCYGIGANKSDRAWELWQMSYTTAAKSFSHKKLLFHMLPLRAVGKNRVRNRWEDKSIRKYRINGMARDEAMKAPIISLKTGLSGIVVKQSGKISEIPKFVNLSIRNY